MLLTIGIFMYSRIRHDSYLFIAIVTATTLFPRLSNATIVEFQTVMGNFEVNLFDNDTPATVANFLDYVDNGAYSNSVYHRSVSNFIVQGGGFVYDPATTLAAIPANAAVTNEPEFSNRRGTIAMAKVGGNPNSATNQWFFNLGNNSVNLDAQNGGFTVFGQVIGNGMEVIDAIAALPVYAFTAPFSELPLINYTAADFGNSVPVDDTHLVLITAIIVSDSTVDSAAGLNPVRNASNSGGGTTNGGGGGGSFGLFALFSLLLVYRLRQA